MAVKIKKKTVVKKPVKDPAEKINKVTEKAIKKAIKKDIKEPIDKTETEELTGKKAQRKYVTDLITAQIHTDTNISKLTEKKFPELGEYKPGKVSGVRWHINNGTNCFVPKQEIPYERIVIVDDLPVPASTVPRKPKKPSVKKSPIKKALKAKYDIGSTPESKEEKKEEAPIEKVKKLKKIKK
ncbi:hypothetical protein DRH27_00100 [Candidatus Falkowbacteria bacterium]|nr:MAG: hypothetical protein DRH27_00100 [Candidatus Falkowbacteria bacterium]